MAKFNTPVPSGRERRAPLVVVVDDEQINVEVISAFLQTRLTLCCLLQRRTGAGLYMFRKPDLAVFDLKMPGMDGITLVQPLSRNTGLARSRHLHHGCR
jgi:CheY-like chemotaxis protein